MSSLQTRKSFEGRSLIRALPVWPIRRPPLHAAAAAGRTAEVEAILRAGVDVDLRNQRGQTALHVAVRRSRVETAALLLRRGASHDLEDARGRTPLARTRVDPKVLHRIRQHYRRMPDGDDGRRRDEADSRVSDWCGDLRRDGILRIPGLVPPQLLSEMKADFDGFVACIDALRQRGAGDKKIYDEEEHWWAEDRAYVSNNAFKHARSLARFCIRPEVGALADLYYGRASFLTRGVAMRYLPHAARENDMFGWHHDLEDRRLKAMILLTDVGENDQRMSYVKGSHEIFHPYDMFFRNGSSLAHCRKHLGEIQIFEGFGRAGDVFFFDSNGTHRGNRRPDARVRDAFFFEFSVDASNIWGGDVPLDRVSAEIADRPDPFREMRRAEKKWARPVTRRFPTWVENLFAIEAWR